MLVKAELKRLGLNHTGIYLGGVNIKDHISSKQRELLKKNLLKSGLELMDDKDSILVEKMKFLIVEMVHYAKEFPKVKASDYISDKMKCSYAHISEVFAENTGISVENYIIAHKIEKTKELLLYEDNTLTQIAFDLNYSSVSHLSAQFKSKTGMTPTVFVERMKPLDIPIEENCDQVNIKVTRH